MIASRPNRRGYALMLVVIFVALFLTMLGLSWRHTASLLRVETVRAVQMRRDRGCLQAAIQGIHYLEKCKVSGDTPSTQQFLIDGFSKTFDVSFSNEGVSGGSTTWKIIAAPTP